MAHPPCARWGRYWSGGPSAHGKFELGDDDNCFNAALFSVRTWGGVLEHPEGSHAWRAFGLNLPPKCGGWINADWIGGWTCCVEQGHYGHVARKATWLYAFGIELPTMQWGPAEARLKFEDSFHSAEERRRAVRTGACQRLSRKQRNGTPPAFRDELIAMARSAREIIT